MLLGGTGEQVKAASPQLYEPSMRADGGAGRIASPGSGGSAGGMGGHAEAAMQQQIMTPISPTFHCQVFRALHPLFPALRHEWMGGGESCGSHRVLCEAANNSLRAPAPLLCPPAHPVTSCCRLTGLTAVGVGGRWGQPQKQKGVKKAELAAGSQSQNTDILNRMIPDRGGGRRRRRCVWRQ